MYGPVRPKPTKSRLEELHERLNAVRHRLEVGRLPRAQAREAHHGPAQPTEHPSVRQIEEAIKHINDIKWSAQLGNLSDFRWGNLLTLEGLEAEAGSAAGCEILIDTLKTIITAGFPVKEAELKKKYPQPSTRENLLQLEKSVELYLIAWEGKLSPAMDGSLERVRTVLGIVRYYFDETLWDAFVREVKVQQWWRTIKKCVQTLETEVELSEELKITLAQGAEWWADKLVDEAERFKRDAERKAKLAGPAKNVYRVLGRGDGHGRAVLRRELRHTHSLG